MVCSDLTWNSRTGNEGSHWRSVKTRLTVYCCLVESEGQKNISDRVKDRQAQWGNWGWCPYQSFRWSRTALIQERVLDPRNLSRPTVGVSLLARHKQTLFGPTTRIDHAFAPVYEELFHLTTVKPLLGHRLYSLGLGINPHPPRIRVRTSHATTASSYPDCAVSCPAPHLRTTTRTTNLRSNP